MYLFFDTETTGLPKRWNAPVTDLENWPRLVQLAWIMYDDRGNMLESRDVIVKRQLWLGIISASTNVLSGLNSSVCE